MKKLNKNDIILIPYIAGPASTRRRVYAGRLIIMPFVYILKSCNFKVTYTGSTVDLPRRLVEHNSGESSHTKKYMPWEIIYKEEYADLHEARCREKYFKTCAGRKLIKKIIESS